MAISLFDLSVPTFLQTVRAIGAFLDRTATYCVEMNYDANDFVNARLFDDMAPFHFQIEAAWHHSVWGIEALKTGAFAPPALVGPVPFVDLRAMISKAEKALEDFTPDEVNSWSTNELNIVLHRPRDKEDDWRPWEPRTMAFTPDAFLLSFSIPNFHFHAVTAYDILRSLGVPLGKRDYEGWLRTTSD